MYSPTGKLNLKTSMLETNWCDCNDIYILVKENKLIAAVPPPATSRNDNNKEVVFKNCAPYTDCISEKNNTQIDNAKNIHTKMSMHNSIW